MRVYAISDIHTDYESNFRWLQALSSEDYTEDVLILAGDVCDDYGLLERSLSLVADRFSRVCFVPGNHDLWVHESEFDCSLEKFDAVNKLCEKLGISTGVVRLGDISLVPLLGWYDYSFAEPDRHLKRGWRDYKACVWPSHLASNPDVNEHFLALNEEHLEETNGTLISYSHFVPRIDLLPDSRSERGVIECFSHDQQVRECHQRLIPPPEVPLNVGNCPLDCRLCRVSLR